MSNKYNDSLHDLRLEFNPQLERVQNRDESEKHMGNDVTSKARGSNDNQSLDVIYPRGFTPSVATKKRLFAHNSPFTIKRHTSLSTMHALWEER